MKCSFVLFLNGLFFHFKGFICPESTNQNYKVIDQTCYYFVSTEKTFADAQKDCKTKFRLIEGMLAEPKTSQSVSALWSFARSIEQDSYYWIGMDDLQNRDGQFRYSSSGVKVPSISGVTLELDNSPVNEDCARLRGTDLIEDHTCSVPYRSICEASLASGSDFFLPKLKSDESGVLV